jgi:hypothetical protein
MPSPVPCDVKSALLDEAGIDAPTMVALQDVALRDTYALWRDVSQAAAADLAALKRAVASLEQARLSPPLRSPAGAPSRRMLAPGGRGASPFVRGRRVGARSIDSRTFDEDAMPAMTMDFTGASQEMQETHADDGDEVPSDLPLPPVADLRESIRPPLPLPSVPDSTPSYR